MSNLSNVEFLEQLTERAQNNELSYEENLLVIELRNKLQMLNEGTEIKEDLWTAISLGIVVMKELNRKA